MACESLYDGNQLPERVSSLFQLVVSILYAFYVCTIMSLGAVALLISPQKLDRELEPPRYMQSLVTKHNIIVHGALALIPAVYAFTHLYTSCLHNGQLYTASNIVLAVVLGFGAKYLGAALQELADEELHMDAIKAVYESLYLCAQNSERLMLLLNSRANGAGGAVRQQKDIFVTPLHDLKTTTSRYVRHDVFLLIGSQDDARFSDWTVLFAPLFIVLRLFNFVPHQWERQAARATWLFCQSSSFRSYTGYMLDVQNIPQILSLASFYSQRLYLQAGRYLAVLTEQFGTLLGDGVTKVDLSRLKIVYASGLELELAKIAESLQKVCYEKQCLNMLCERYACRRTPVFTMGERAMEEDIMALRWCIHYLYGPALTYDSWSTSAGEWTC